MAEEEKNDKQQTEEPATEEKAPEAEEKAADMDHPTESPTPGGSGGEAEQPPVDGGGGNDEEAEQPPAEAKEQAPAGDGDGASEDELDWKARRRLERSRQPIEARPQQAPEERASERATRRAAASKERRSHRLRRRSKHEKGTGTAQAEKESVARKIRQGRVVSSKSDKTITVQIDVARRHPTYEKVVRRSGTLRAHDERNEAGEGDLVQVVETRPLSKTKRWRLTKILEKAK